MTPGCDSRGRNDLRGRGGPSGGRWAGCGSPTSPTMQSSMAPSQVVLGGRKVAIRRPRVRCAGAELRIQRGALHLPVPVQAHRALAPLTVRREPGPRNPARETLACSPAATSPWARVASAAPRPRLLKSPGIQEKTRGRPRVIPEREHQQDWVAVGAVSREPVSPRFSPRASWANNSRMWMDPDYVPQYPDVA